MLIIYILYIWHLLLGGNTSAMSVLSFLFENECLPCLKYKDISKWVWSTKCLLLWRTFFLLSSWITWKFPSMACHLFCVSDSIWQDHKSPKRLHRISLTSCLLSYKYPYKTSLAWHHHALMNGVKWRGADMPSHACCHKSFHWTSPNGPIVLEPSTHRRQTLL